MKATMVKGAMSSGKTILGKLDQCVIFSIDGPTDIGGQSSVTDELWMASVGCGDGRAGLQYHLVLLNCGGCRLAAASAGDSSGVRTL